MNNKSKAKLKLLHRVDSNRMFGFGTLVISTPRAAKYQLDSAEIWSDIMAFWDGKKLVVRKNRLGPLVSANARTMIQAMKVINRVTA